MSYAKSLLDLDDVSVSGASSIESRRSSKCASSPKSRSSGHSNMVFTPVHKVTIIHRQIESWPIVV